MPAYRVQGASSEHHTRRGDISRQFTINITRTGWALLPAHRHVLSSVSVPISLTHLLHRIWAASVLAIIVLSLLVAPGAWAETYTSSNSDYPSTFANHQYGSYHNDVQVMRVVYFGGRDIAFFILISIDPMYGSDYTRNLHFLTDSPSYSGQLNFGNNSTLNFRFKPVARNEVLYVSYATSITSNGFTPTVPSLCGRAEGTALRRLTRSSITRSLTDPCQ